MPLVDTHCHLDLIAKQGQITIKEALNLASQAKLDALVQIATDLPSSLTNQSLAKECINDNYPKIHWTVGLHPETASKGKGNLEKIFEIAQKHKEEANFLGLGETGLDYFQIKEKSEVENQKDCFMAHIEKAKKWNLPIVLHTRDDRSYNPEKTHAIDEALEMIKGSNVRGVLHCYTYTYKEAIPFVELGWFVSYSGILTFSNAKIVQEGACQLPLEALLVETDAPFLSPVPYRGKLNQPAYVQYTLEALAKLRSENCGENIEMVKQKVFENSQRFLNLKKST